MQFFLSVNQYLHHNLGYKNTFSSKFILVLRLLHFNILTDTTVITED